MFLLFPFTNWVIFELSLGWGETEVVREELRKIRVSPNHFETEEYNVMATASL